MGEGEATVSWKEGEGVVVVGISGEGEATRGWGK